MSETTYELTVQPASSASEEQELHDVVESAFSTGLAAAIMSEFPVASIIAIFRGQKGKKLVMQADEITARTGIRGGVKRILAKIFSIYGFINGIVCTALYAWLGTYLTIYAIIWTIFAIFYILALIFTGVGVMTLI